MAGRKTTGKKFGRFLDSWVVDRVMFEYVNQGGCNCCGFTHAGMGMNDFMQLCSDVETDDGKPVFRRATSACESLWALSVGQRYLTVGGKPAATGWPAGCEPQACGPAANSPAGQGAALVTLGGCAITLGGWKLTRHPFAPRTGRRSSARGPISCSTCGSAALPLPTHASSAAQPQRGRFWSAGRARACRPSPC